MAFPAGATVGDLWTEGGIRRRWDSKRWSTYDNAVATGGGTVPTFTDHGNVTTTKTIDVTAASYQRITLTSSSCAITFSGTPSAGQIASCVLIIKKDNNATVRAVTWANAPEWPNDTAPIIEGQTANVETSIQIDTYSDGTRRGYPAGVHFP